VIFLVAGLVLLGVLLLLARGFVNADPAKLGRLVRWFLIGLGAAAAAAVLILLVATDRFAPAFGIVAVVAPFLLRNRRLWRRSQNVGGPAPGKTSEVEAEFLRMQLDHDTGAMSGTVLRGAFAGRRLDELDANEVLALWRECRIGDEASARLVEAYLDRLRPDWRQAEDEPAGARATASGNMTREEAYAILGLSPGADAAQIKDAHRTLMMKLHPDHGGSTYIAAQINRAKEILLGG
jgi:hypothetical protein